MRAPIRTHNRTADVVLGGLMIIRTSTAPVRSGVLEAPFTAQRWFQMGLGFVLSVVLPTILIWLIWPKEAIDSEGLRNSALASFAAFLIGLLWYRRLGRHPGVQGLENVLTVFMMTYAVAATTLLLARLGYNRAYMLSSFSFTLIGFTLLVARTNAVDRPNFHVVPFGSFDRLIQMPRASWILMRGPAIPQKSGTALVADLRAEIPDDWQRMIADAVLSGIPVFHVKQIEEALSGRVDIEHMSENQFGSLLPSLSYRKMKTLIDVGAAVLLLPILILPFLIVTVCIKLDSPGPVFFRQSRVGLGGSMFQVFKFRSMHHQVVASNEADQRSEAMTQSNDSRITRVGKILRRYRIDELPQIFNVLAGEMSWIGPRPEALALSKWYLAELPFYQYRHIVKPGITGWAQVNQGHVTDLAAVRDKLRYDFYYIKYFSLWLDLLILLRTIRIVLFGYGAK